MTEILHFTHLDNFPHIITDGGLLSDAACARLNRTPVRSGDKDIKERRLRWSIRGQVGRGGHVGDYVPFYYAPKSPMLFSIQGGGVDGVGRDPDGLVYLVAHAEDFNPPDFIVTDGNAAAGRTSYYGTLEALSEVDWDVMREEYWNNTTADPDRKRRRAAEFLVFEKVSWQRIHRLVTRTAETRTKLDSLIDQSGLKHRPPITVDASWYY